jgi:hypothetical protein
MDKIRAKKLLDIQHFYYVAGGSPCKTKTILAIDLALLPLGREFQSLVKGFYSFDVLLRMIPHHYCTKRLPYRCT